MLVLLAVDRGTASAQYHIDTWTTDQGLPQSTVANVVQTPDGFIWASTLGGLVRFDGVRFRVYDTATNPELSNSRIGAMFTDAAGNIWMVTQDKDLLRFQGGKFKKMGSADGLPAGLVTRALKDGGRDDVQTTAGSVLVDNGRIVPDTRPGPPPALSLKQIGTSAGGARWFADAAGLAYRYDGSQLTRSPALPKDRAERVYEDRAGRVWMRSRETGELLCLTGNTVHRYGPKDGVIHLGALSMSEDPDGTVWFSSESGLVRFHDGRFRSFTTADGLPDNNVGPVFRDREGSVWVPTQRGLARLTEQPITTYSVEQGLAARNTYPVFQDSRGDIWIGGWNGLTRYRRGVFEDMTTAGGVVRPMVLSFAETRDGAILVGFYSGQVHRLTVAGPDAHVSAVLVVARPSPVYAVHPGRSGDIWIADDQGAVRFHDGVVDPPVPGTQAASAFYQDDHGVLWIGAAAGLVRYANGVATQFGAREGFTGKRVRTIYASADGSLWLGTYDTGLFRFRDGTFTRYTLAEGLPASGAFQILEDGEARFWISSNSGIYRVAKSELDDVAAGRRRRVTAVRYGRDDGMLDQECNGLGRPAGVRATDGKIWFPTQDGVVVIDPQTSGRQPPPPVTILDAVVDGVPVPLDRIEIRSGSRALDVRYAALTFVKPELAQFRYRMEGLEPDWHDDAGSDHTARYAQMPYGHFTFRVIAANREGVWNETGASIPVVVVPPFWRTTWFMSLAFLAFVGAGFGTHRLRLGVIERRRALQEAFARQLIDSQETDRKRIASDLHDGVSQTLVVIRNWAQIGEPSLPEDSAGRKRMGDIGRAAAQALGEVREVVQDLVPYHLDRQGLVESIRDAAARVADASGVQITCRLAEIHQRLSPATTLKLFRVVQEGLNNVVKHSGATSASIDLVLESAHVMLTIRDNGKGFVKDNVTPTAAGDGFGLMGMSERTRMMGGEMTIDSAPGRGTTITIVVPTAQVDSNPDR